MAVFTVVNDTDLTQWMLHYDLGEIVEFPRHPFRY